MTPLFPVPAISTARLEPFVRRYDSWSDLGILGTFPENDPLGWFHHKGSQGGKGFFQVEENPGHQGILRHSAC